MTNQVLSAGTASDAVSAYLERLAEALDVPPSRYDEAKRRYKSVGEWLGREESTLKDLEPEVYVQGSFRLGTPIRPANEDEHYDVDLVCELTAATKKLTQKRLKELLGYEMALYAKAHSMKALSESRRCWTLEYADGAQFHLDALPAISDGEGRRRVLAARGFNNAWTATSIAITDNTHALYQVVCDEWPHSNPKGYTNWFRSRMRVVFEARRNAMALDEQASVEDIPSYRVKTPLQQAIQILKRHRDLMFADDPDNKPISIILTTLAGMAYQNESNVALALQSILQRMDSFIGADPRGAAVIPNPTDPLENFADRWRDYPRRRECFYAWLARARTDYAELAAQREEKRLVEVASRFAGSRVAAQARTQTSARASSLLSSFSRLGALIHAPHRQQAPWPRVQQGGVQIAKASWRANGFSRPMRFYNDATPLKKGASLTFEAETDVLEPFDVYWQVVNTGEEARLAGGLRGGFSRGKVDRGGIVRYESTLYSGSHTIECFIVKQGYLLARSGPFVVNIA